MSPLRAADLGQLLFLEVGDNRWSAALERRLQTLRPGGLLISASNLKTPEATAEFLAKCARAMDTAPFLAVKEGEEGLAPLGSGTPVLPTLRVAAKSGTEAAEKLGDLLGAGLELLGFNSTFAPLLDLSAKAGMNVDAALANCAEVFIRGLEKHKVLSCPGNFPGLGDARPDPDSNLMVSGKPMARMWSEDLAPYRKILPQVQLLMVSDNTYKAYDLEAAIPAALSANVLQGLLRVKLGYTGVALAEFDTTARKVRGAQKPVTARSISTGDDLFPKSIMAGVDMLVVGGEAPSADRAAEQLRKAAESGALPEERIAEGLTRIGRAKKGVRIPTGKFSGRSFDRLCRAIEEFKKHCPPLEHESA